MKLKKTLRSKRAQAMIEYLVTSIVIAAAVIAVGLLPKVRTAFTGVTASMMSQF